MNSTGKALVTVVAMVVACLQLSCKKDEPLQPHVTSVQLSVEDASCTEAWLKVSLTDPNEPRTVAIQQDGRRVLTARIVGPDSLLVVEGLFPRHTYSFTAQRLRDTTAIDASTAVQATTMDTTTHNFTFHLDTLGISSSTLSDVAIVNDTLAYAVGEIYIRDSTGQFDDTPYNLAKWNGEGWELLRVSVTFRGNLITPPLYGIYAFSSNDIWLAAGMAIHGDGVHWLGYDVRALTGYDTLSFTKCWGSSSTDMYFVGLCGSMAHYGGGSWQRIESGTNVTLNDVWGGSNRWVGQNVVLIAAGNKYTAGETKILRIKGTEIPDTIAWRMQDRVVNSIWFDSHSQLFTSGGGVFCYRGAGSWREQPIPLIYTNRIRGNGQNDVWAVGDFGIAAHYNGVTWRDFPEVRLPGNYESVAVKGNVMIAVGWIGSRAVILRGTHN